MPSGFTDVVADGEITDRNKFLLRCARGMGALYELRDDPLDSPLPEKLSSSSSRHYADKIVECNKELKKLLRMSKREIELAWQKDTKTRYKAWEEQVEDVQLKKKRYQEMSAMVDTWNPPTEEHEGLKKFALEQLLESERADCHSIGAKFQVDDTSQDWHNRRVESLEEDIVYYEKRKVEEDERNRHRNEWLRQLRDSLKEEN
jgi:hypothetical protein